MTLWLAAESLHCAYATSWGERIASGADDLPARIAIGLPPGAVALGEVDGGGGGAPLLAALAPGGGGGGGGWALPAGSSVVATWGLASGNFEAVRLPLETEEARAYFKRAEALAAWFIDGATPVDLTDPRWEAVMLYNVTAGEPAAAARRVCAGYVTVFTFHNPLRATERERPTSLRVCQMLLLPPFQRRGAYVCVCVCARCACSRTEWEYAHHHGGSPMQGSARGCLGSCTSGPRRATPAR